MKLGSLHRFAFCVGTAVLLGGACYSDFAAAREPSARSKKDDKKENAYPHATRQEPKVSLSESAQKKINKAFDLMQEEKYAEAEKLADEVQNDGKATPYAKALALQTKGQVKWNQDDNLGAIELMKQAIALDAMPNGNQFAAMFQLAQLYLMEEKYQESLAVLDDYVKQSGDNSSKVLAVRGNDLYRLEKYPEAIETIKQALANSDKPEDSWRQILMASYFETEQYGEAAKVLEADLAKDPNNKKAIQQLASVYINDKQEAKAQQLMADAKAKGLFTTEDDYKQLAQLYNVADKPKDAAAVLEEGFQKGIIKPSYAMYKLLGDSYSLAEEDDKGIEAYAKASPLASDGEADFLRGQLLINRERWADAKAAMTQALSRGVKRQGAAYVLLGNAENELGNKQGAIAAMEKAKNYDETRKMAETWLKAIKGGVTVRTQPAQKQKQPAQPPKK